MKLGVLSVIATLLAIIVINCAGNEIVPATPAPGAGDRLAALYAAPPAGAAFITVNDHIEADIVTAADVPFDAAGVLLYGYGYELVLPFAETTPAWDAPLEVLDLELATADAVALPVHVDIDARFVEALAAAAAAVDAQPVVVERGPEMQQPLEGWEAAPLDAK